MLIKLLSFSIKMSPRNKILSHLDLHRKHNVRYFDNAQPRWSGYDVWCMIRSYLDVFPETCFNVLRNARNSNYWIIDTVKYRNTSFEEMKASNYNVGNTLKRLKNSAFNTISKSNFSTATFNRKMRQNYLPSDRFARAASIAGLMVNIVSTTTKDVIQRLIKGENDNIIKNSLTSDDNVGHVVECLCKMRGIALKFGQILSLQYGILPENFRQAFINARHSADIMTEEEVENIMAKQFGQKWMDKFLEFSFTPMASASIGQAHMGKLKNGENVVVKIQFPGVLDSIDSDLNNILWLFKYTKLLPERFFIDQLVNEMKIELITECDYLNEAKFYKIFDQLKLDGFHIPEVIHELTTPSIITTQFVKGVPIEETARLSQNVRDSIGHRILKLGLNEIFIFGLMNTDPNPSNYLYDESTDLIGLIDFGSCRMYNKKFINEYYNLVFASVNLDYDEILNTSKRLGFLSNDDEQSVVDAHIDSVIITGEPFRCNGLYEFGKCNIIKMCFDNSIVILKRRQQPPPPEIYSLHRKLAGCFIICKLLSANVDANKIFKDITTFYME